MGLGESPREEDADEGDDDDEDDAATSPRRTPKASVKGEASKDVAAAAERARSPDSIKESGEEVGLAGRGNSSVASVGGGKTVTIASPAPTPLETDAPFQNRSITMESETTPLATIKQRYTQSKDFGLEGDDDGSGDEDKARGDSMTAGRSPQVEEGTEFTLEEHQSWKA